MGKPLAYSMEGDNADWETVFFFGLPFGIAGRIIRLVQVTYGADRIFSLANEEE